MINHYEMHTYTSIEDEKTARTFGGLPVPGKRGNACAHCNTMIGSYLRPYIPVAVVLNDTQAWFLCLDCAAPITNPRQ